MSLWMCERRDSHSASTEKLTLSVPSRPAPSRPVPSPLGSTRACRHQKIILLLESRALPIVQSSIPDHLFPPASGARRETALHRRMQDEFPSRRCSHDPQHDDSIIGTRLDSSPPPPLPSSLSHGWRPPNYDGPPPEQRQQHVAVTRESTHTHLCCRGRDTRLAAEHLRHFDRNFDVSPRQPTRTQPRRLRP